MRNLFVFAFFLISFTINALEWPVEKIILTATFGESRQDHFHTGIDLAGGEQTILPISPGEMIFSYEKGSDYSSCPVGLGNFVVLQHQEGIRSIYCHLKDNTLNRSLAEFSLKDPLGTIGDSGHSQGKHLHLSLIDSEMKTIINPFLVLPPLTDRQAPVIRRLFFKKKGELVELRDGDELKTGELHILAEIYDLREDVSFIWKLAPYKILLYVNGQEVNQVSFNFLQAKEGRLVLSDTGESFKELYVSDWIYSLGSLDLIPGETHLQVFTRDFAGNMVQCEYFFQVIN